MDPERVPEVVPVAQDKQQPAPAIESSPGAAPHRRKNQPASEGGADVKGGRS